MKLVKWNLSIGYSTATQEGEFEVEDDTPDDEIEEIAQEIILGYVDWGWEVEGGDSD